MVTIRVVIGLMTVIIRIIKVRVSISSDDETGVDDIF